MSEDWREATDIDWDDDWEEFVGRRTYLDIAQVNIQEWLEEPTGARNYEGEVITRGDWLLHYYGSTIGTILGFESALEIQQVAPGLAHAILAVIQTALLQGALIAAGDDQIVQGPLLAEFREELGLDEED